MKRTPLLVFLANVLLWTLQSQLNHYISSWNLTIFMGGLCVVFAALRLSFRDGVWALILTGLWFDAATPVPLGLHVFLFLFAQMILFSFRSRIAREENLVGVLIGVIVNLAIIIAISVGLLHRNPAPIQMWPRLIGDSLISFCAIVLIAPWSFAFQERLLHFAGVNLRREQLGMG